MASTLKRMMPFIALVVFFCHAARAEKLAVWKFFAASGGVILTTDSNQAETIAKRGYPFFGRPLLEFYAENEPGPGLIPLYSFVDAGSDELYTFSKDAGGDTNYRATGQVGYFPDQFNNQSIPVFQYIDNDTHTHVYTTDGFFVQDQIAHGRGTADFGHHGYPFADGLMAAAFRDGKRLCDPQRDYHLPDHSEPRRGGCYPSGANCQGHAPEGMIMKPH